ncbi:MAG: hypothetical protein CSB33_05215 [Desulfobacterales bacterium]|nr:MAG: hypothetical protein CSB33_05215 [Desulfobacterales bacterium]
MLTGRTGEIDLTVDTQNLYREESITDLKAASIRRLIPITENGDVDETREMIFMGSIQVMTPGGTLPVQGELKAGTLKEAIAKFPDAMQHALNDLLEEFKRLEQEAGSRIVVPQAGGVPGMGMPGGGAPGGGIIY